MDNNWSIQTIWNDLITEERQPQKRDYIRASDIGKPYLDRYLTMKGVPITNPFDARILRVFNVGNAFEEDVVGRIFHLLGIMVKTQEEVVVKTPGLLNVVGHYDYKIGGKVQLDRLRKLMDRGLLTSVFDKAREIDPDVAEILEALYPSDWMRNRSLKLAEKLNEQYPNGLQVLMSEIKTVNSRAFWSHKNMDKETGFFKGYDHHKLQLFTYAKATGLPGRLFYISKDDMTLLETSVNVTPTLEALWLDDVSRMSDYVQKNIEPPKEDDVIFNEEKREWEFNWKISRSSYFTFITGFEKVEDWERAHYGQLKMKNTAKCHGCKKPFLLATLNKNLGFCARCAKTV